MRRRQVLVFVAGAAVVSGAGLLAVPGTGGAWAVAAGRGASVPGGQSRAAGSWGRAIEVPGLGALNNGGNASVNEVSCSSAGNCAAGGSYSNDTGAADQGFVAVERHGRWTKAIEVPGLGALNRGQDASVNSVSCGSTGSCTAGGNYTDRRGHSQGFVVSQAG